ncbi:Brp/Blh family beta-carotene 15,15'-monooxygenase [Salinibacter ruber]|uniref:Brp/Blh family beta-carotene 15,15'-dioxygenase n=1 Tax=Salinibacter ruber TaxID=146919 RepID=UPI00216814D3|nr:Brp/Blh family beta-carotene 15,15'-dioxygenase [Salinibacter ruber]MCS4032445.1 Brp/Blh family beta-carotene 15,15'-monooxygenase [Salinibacter ruber]
MATSTASSVSAPRSQTPAQSPTALAVWGSRITLGALAVGGILAALLDVSLSMEAQMVGYLIGMVALNLPHGGYEHFENLRHRRISFSLRYIVLYLAFLIGFVGFFFVAPVVALGLAFSTAVIKGGHGGLKVMDALCGTEHLQSSWQRGLAAFVRGGAVMLVPLLAWPGVYVTFSTYMVHIFGAAAPLPLATRLADVQVAVGTVYGLALVAHLGGGLYAGGLSRAWLTDAAETTLLVVYFTFVPMMLAVGLYFPLWYTLRQTARTTAVASDAPAPDRLSLPLTWAAMVLGALVTFGLMAGFYVLVPNPLGGAGLLGGAVAFYTIFVCLLALPHIVVGEWLDPARGIWYVP